MVNVNELGISKQYLDLELPNTVDDYLLWLGYKERNIYFNDDVDSRIVNSIVHWINRWNEEDKDLPQDQKKPINIFITSNGGDVVSGFSVLDVVKSSKTPVITTAVGCAASMGILLLMCGHHRRAYPNTVLLIHDGSLHAQGSSNKVKSTMAFYDKLDKRVKKFILANSKITEELYDKNSDMEWFMFADDEGIELGIVDELI